MGGPRALLEAQRQMLCPVGGMHMGREHCPCRRQLQPGCFAPFDQRQPWVHTLTPPASCSSQIRAKPTPFETEVTRGGLSAAALISIPYTSSHLALVPRERHHGEENSLSVLRAGMHQGGDTDADILVSDFLAPHGTAAFALGNTGQPP